MSDVVDMNDTVAREFGLLAADLIRLRLSVDDVAPLLRVVLEDTLQRRGITARDVVETAYEEMVRLARLSLAHERALHQ